MEVRWGGGGGGENDADKDTHLHMTFNRLYKKI